MPPVYPLWGMKSINKTSKYNNENYIFEASELVKNGYIKSLESPIDNKNLSECIKIKVTHDNGVRIVDLIDNCY